MGYAHFMRLLIAALLALPLAACAAPPAETIDSAAPLKARITVKSPVARPGLPPLVPLSGLSRASSIAPGTASVSGGGGPGR